MFLTASNNRLTSLTILALAGSANAQDFRALQADPSVLSVRSSAVSDDGLAVVCTTTSLQDGRVVSSASLWSDGVFSLLTSPVSSSGLPLSTSVLATSFETGSHIPSGILVAVADSASAVWSPQSNTVVSLHRTTDKSSPQLYLGARALSSSSSQVFGSSLADLDGDGRLDVAASSWSSSSDSPPSFLSVDPLSDFSFASSCSSDGSVVVGARGRVDRSASVDYSPEEFSLQATLWRDGSMAQVSSLSSFASSSFSLVCDDGSSAVCVVTDATGTERSLVCDLSSGVLSEVCRPSSGGPDEDCDGVFISSLSSDASVLGGSVLLADGSSRATFWTRSPDGSFSAIDLHTFLSSSGVDLSGVTLHEITGVSSNGLHVTGRLTDASGLEGSFVASVPTPGAFVLVGMAGLLTAKRRRGA